MPRRRPCRGWVGLLDWMEKRDSFIRMSPFCSLLRWPACLRGNFNIVDCKLFGTTGLQIGFTGLRRHRRPLKKMPSAKRANPIGPRERIRVAHHGGLRLTAITHIGYV